MRVGLIACCKQKLDHAAPAQDLYTSPFFRLSKQWITYGHRCEEWGILSAKHGLVLPDQVVEPYDACLSDFSKEKKDRWASMVHAQLLEQWPEQVIWLVLMGGEYKRAVSKMKYVEDVIECWTQWRRDKGMTGRRASMSIGLILKAMKENQGFY